MFAVSWDRPSLILFQGFMIIIFCMESCLLCLPMYPSFTPFTCLLNVCHLTGGAFHDLHLLYIFFSHYLLLWLCQVLVMTHEIFHLCCSMRTLVVAWESSSLTRCWNLCPCLWSMEYYPLDHHGSPSIYLLIPLYFSYSTYYN